MKRNQPGTVSGVRTCAQPPEYDETAWPGRQSRGRRRAGGHGHLEAAVVSAQDAAIVETVGETIFKYRHSGTLAAMSEGDIEVLRRHRDVLHLMVKNMETVVLLVRTDLWSYQLIIVYHAYGRAALIPPCPEGSDPPSSEANADWGSFVLMPDGRARVRVDRTGAVLELPRRFFSQQPQSRSGARATKKRP